MTAANRDDRIFSDMDPVPMIRRIQKGFFFMIKIMVDSSSDYPVEELKEKGIGLVPISITIGNNSYIDGINLERNDFYRILMETREFPKTSQPSPQSFLEQFQEAKEKGDEIIYLALSSALSGTFQSARVAKEMVEYDKIHIIDTLTATYNIKLMADYACRLRAQGVKADEIVNIMEQMKSHVKVLAVPDTLEYLYRGGRLSRTAAVVGDIANIKPIITVTKDGHVSVIGKSLGRNKAILAIQKHLKEMKIDTDFPVYSIYSFGTGNLSLLEEKLAAEGLAITDRLQIGPTIGTHIGPEAFGIVFVTKDE